MSRSISFQSVSILRRLRRKTSAECVSCIMKIHCLHMLHTRFTRLCSRSIMYTCVGGDFNPFHSNELMMFVCSIWNFKMRSQQVKLTKSTFLRVNGNRLQFEQRKSQRFNESLDNLHRWMYHVFYFVLNVFVEIALFSKFGCHGIVNAS